MRRGQSSNFGTHSTNGGLAPRCADPTTYVSISDVLSRSKSPTSGLPNFLHHTSGQFEVTFGIHLRYLAVGVPQDHLGRLQAELFSDDCRPRMTQLVRVPDVLVSPRR